ncbi:MAG: SRPBCC family protein [Acidimicrobiales bacterium]
MADETRSFAIDQAMAASASAIYRAWTEEFDTWFASPGAIRMTPRAGEPYWFEVIHNGDRHPHYGRFLALEPGQLIEQTWVTGRNGTDGAETVVKIELEEIGSGTQLRLTHSGFYDARSAQNHADSWPRILSHLETTLVGER